MSRFPELACGRWFVAQAEQGAPSPLSPRSVEECEKLVKAACQRNGLVYQESGPEDQGEEGCPLSPEVIEIDDEDDDDDVIAVGCCELYDFISVHPVKKESVDLSLRSFSGSTSKDGSSEQRPAGERKKTRPEAPEPFL